MYQYVLFYWLSDYISLILLIIGLYLISSVIGISIKSYISAPLQSKYVDIIEH